MEKDFGLKEYWDWLRRRKRGLDSKDWMNGLSEYGDWVLTGRQAGENSTLPSLLQDLRPDETCRNFITLKISLKIKESNSN